MLSRRWALCLISLAWSSSLGAQTFGEIGGFVLDPASQPVAEVKVTVRNQLTGQSRSATTMDSGAYSIPLLLPGVYEVTAERQGFRKIAISDIGVEVDRSARADFRLEIGAVEQTVEVVAVPQLIQNTGAAIGTIFTQEQIADTPLNGRNYLSLIKLAPNVSAEMRGDGGTKDARQGGERSNQPISIGGQRQEFNRYSLDGVENTDVNFNSYLVRPSIDAIREVKVQTGVYSAEYGRATSQIIVATKSGTNDFHGALFEFHRNDNFDAKGWRSDGPKEPLVRNQFGFTLGGPLVRNRLFFLSNLEVLRERRTSEDTASVAPDAMRAGDLSSQNAAIFDPLSRVFETIDGNEVAVAADRFPNDVIPLAVTSQ